MTHPSEQIHLDDGDLYDDDDAALCVVVGSEPAETTGSSVLGSAPAYVLLDKFGKAYGRRGWHIGRMVTQHLQQAHAKGCGCQIGRISQTWAVD